MTTKHTKGRLKIGTPPPNGEQTIGTESGLMVAVVTRGVDHPAEANARRLVACWNWCEGQETEGLEMSTKIGRTAKDFINEAYTKELTLIAQRDELLEALRRIEGSTMSMYATRSDMLEHCQDMARAAIAKVEGTV